jgi:hypothetical protein
VFNIFEAMMGGQTPPQMPEGKINLDSMNITIDKVASVAALQEAETAFLNTAKQLRINGREDLAQHYEKQASVLAGLLIQVGNNGAKFTVS